MDPYANPVLPTLEETESRVNAWSKQHDAKVLSCHQTAYRLLWECDGTDRYIDVTLNPYDVSINGGFRQRSSKQITALQGSRVPHDALEIVLEDMWERTGTVLARLRQEPPQTKPL